MNESELRRRLAEHRQIPLPDPNIGPTPPIVEPPPGTIAAPATSDDALDLGQRPLVAAAVLVPILTGNHPAILLTKRTAHLRAHAGQVSFPGGRIDAADATPEHAALREAEEEVGLNPACVEVVGRLAAYVTGTGYQITPILGLVPPDPKLLLSSHEVEAVFRFPLDVLLDPAAPQRRRAHYRGRWREFWVWPHTEHYIWGATAAIMVHLAHTLRASSLP
jgi:8-oxo-dGTP pyrophosphatase MutT (NUDIX family)